MNPFESGTEEHRHWNMGYAGEPPERVEKDDPLPHTWNGIPAGWWGGHNTKYYEEYLTKRNGMV